uniref:Uncharacterized protein n=1 Tax=Arundo donax TaxID=35708 RepID=A0A0A8YWE9_ARUDO
MLGPGYHLSQMKRRKE